MKSDRKKVFVTQKVKTLQSKPVYFSLFSGIAYTRWYFSYFLNLKDFPS